MLAQLEDAVEALDVPIDAAALRRLFRVLDRLDARVVEAVDRFDEAKLWQRDQAPSLTAWLMLEARLTQAVAGRLSRQVTRLRDMPEVRAAWRVADLSSGHVDVIVRNVTGRTVRLFETGEAERVVVLSQLSVADAAVAMRHWAAAARDALQPDPGDPNNDPDEAELPSTVHASRTLHGRMVLNGDLDIDDAEAVEAALARAADPELAFGFAERRGAALGRVCRFFLDNHGQTDLPAAKPGVRRARAQVHVIIGRDGVAENEAGIRLPESMVERLLCDAKVNTVRFADGQVLYYGKDRRSTPAHLYDALVVRDRGCRFAGCCRPAYWSDAHHVTAWNPNTSDGPTDITNMVLLCDLHHNMVHRPGWSAVLMPDAEFVVTDPDGKQHRSRPPGDPDDRPRLPL